MRKLKYILLFVILIFGLNSCLTTLVGWGICEQYGGCYDLKKSDPGGIDNYFYKNPLEAKQYIKIWEQLVLIIVKDAITLLNGSLCNIGHGLRCFSYLYSL